MSDIVERLKRDASWMRDDCECDDPGHTQCRWSAHMIEAAAEITRLRDEVERLRADLALFDADTACEGCGAPLWEGDDYVTDPDAIAGCWRAMTDLPSNRERPCFAYRVGKAPS